MPQIDFQSFSLPLNLAIFGVAAGIVWFLGIRISLYVDGIADRTGLGQAFLGALLLAAATSSPELSTIITASASGNAPLAVNNLFGGIALQTAVLAVIDLIVMRGALSFFTPKPVLLLSGILLVALLAFTLMGITAGASIGIAGVGLSSIVLLVLYFGSLFLINRYEKNQEWKPANPPTEKELKENKEEERRERREAQRKKRESIPTWRLVLFFLGSTALILMSGVILTKTSEAMAEQTGLGASFVGVTLLALATSLPEVSTTLTSARIGNYDVAFANIFGSNAFLIGLIFVGDLFYAGDPILSTIDRSGTFAVQLGIVVTTIYLAGLVERDDRTIFRLGIDSAMVLALYFGGLVVLYLLK